MKHRATEQQRNQDLTSETAFTRKVSLKKTFSRSFFFIFALLLCCSVFQMLFIGSFTDNSIHFSCQILSHETANKIGHIVHVARTRWC